MSGCRQRSPGRPTQPRERTSPAHALPAGLQHRGDARDQPPYILRGGSYYDDARRMRCAVRLTSIYDDTWGRGFRVSLSTP
ncbi:MAG: hypothetical protein AB8I80_23680 [Anaerolineae bacterium]